MNRVFSWPVGQGNFTLPARYSIVFGISSTVGGIVLGALLAGVVSASRFLPRELVLIAAAVVAFLAVGLQLMGQMAFLPERRRQVPSEWLQRSPLWYSAAFGFVIGFAALTWIYHAIAYGILAALVARGDPRLAFWTGVTLGAVRGALPFVHRRLSSGVAARLETYLASPRFEIHSRLSLGILATTLLVQIVISTGGP
ncbi:MAG: hypothetical protein ABR548_03925 [Actinomycetota bacterium]|nr:hypothetical protein [Actinomycetota bacterium]